MKEWVKYKLGDLFEVKAGGDLLEQFYSKQFGEETPFPIYSNTLVNKGLYGYTSNPRYPGNCITITGRGEIGHAEYRDKPFDAIVRLLVLIPKAEVEVDCRLITYYINCMLNFAVESTGVPQLPAPRVIKLKIKIPFSLEEQIAIATILSLVDEAIVATQDSIKAAEKLKKALMQNLLTGKLKTDGIWRKEEFQITKIGLIPKHWQMKTVKEISIQVTDGEHTTPMRSESGFFLLSARNIKNSYLDLSDVDYVEETELRKIQKRCNPQAGDILISCSGTIGNVCMVPEGLDAGMVRSVALIKLKKEEIEPEFAELVFQSFSLQNQMKISVASSVQGNIFQGAIKKLKIPYPPQEERIQITSKIKGFSSLIIEKQTKIQRLQRLKKSLMQNLLTGKVRLSEELIHQLAEREYSTTE